jgi:class 3 adenylate cyclase
MFGDLVGFTAWSSVREPTQVFQLLETIYHAFDEVARRRRVFKVETVGDCYVAVVGLPGKLLYLFISYSTMLEARESHLDLLCSTRRTLIATL